MADEDLVALKERFELLKGAEQHKNTLIEELLRRLDQKTAEYDQEKLDHAREKHFNREVQMREIQLGSQLRNMQAVMDRDAFILVLIDGDGLIFDNNLISKGEAGGKEAALLLDNAIHENVEKRMPDLIGKIRVVTRIYANLKGLGYICYRDGILEHAALMEDFARGFTGSRQLFDFIDVGAGKDRADDKISEIFKLHLYDSHCRHIYMGCSHDNGYARLLEEIGDTTIINSVTLVEGVPFEKELVQLKTRYHTTKFEGLFRTEKIDIYNAPSRAQAKAPPQPNGVSFSTPTQYQSPYQPTISPDFSGVLIPRPDSASNISLNPTAPSWAATAKAPPTVSPHDTPVPQKRPLEAVVPRNKYGQRIDPAIKYDPTDLQRIKKMKMCNVHFLRNDCPYDPCTHDHYYKPTLNELNTLRYVSRMTPCRYGMECDDLKCIYGHRCPVSKEGENACRYGENCRFPREAHQVDLRVVDTVRIGGK